MRPLRFALGAAALLSANAMALDASSLKLQVYSVMLSTSAQCTSPVTVFASATPTEVDFLAAPMLGSGNPPDGTYQCVIIKMSDLIKFTPSSAAGLCAAGTQYTADVCRSDNSGMTQAPDAVGAPNACNGTDAAPVADAVYLYLTTNASAGSGGNTFMQPTGATSTNGLPLTAPLVIAGTAKSKFVVNATGKVGDDGVSCGMNPPVFGFQKLP
ncbi:MAG TPA: hypothetical protein VH041_00915 [Caldimonas sp.]|nr:hypothetical protein [Caldimonas sp.]HEX4232840.1 hypothetical protein [Caldimonas sp.]